MNSAESLHFPARVLAVTFDCTDPRELARFYQHAVGLPLSKESDDFVLLGELDGTGLAFYRLATYQRPTWPAPGVEKQAHLELGVGDLNMHRTGWSPCGQPCPTASLPIWAVGY